MRHGVEHSTPSEASTVPELPKWISQTRADFLEYHGEQIRARAHLERGKVLEPWYDETMLRIQEHLLRPDIANQFLTKFFTRIRSALSGQDVEQGISIDSPADISRVQDIFKQIFDFDNSAIELHTGDIIQFDPDTGNVNILTPGASEGKTITPSGIIPLTIPSQNPDTQKEESEIRDLSVADALATHLTRRAPVRTGANSCGRAVHMTLSQWGLKNTPRGNGNQWNTLLAHDSRFEKIHVTDLSSIPAGAILCFSGKGKRGSAMNKKYGHVEIKGKNDMYYSYYASKNPGGSAKAPEHHNNWEKWVAETGFQEAYIPISKDTPKKP